MTFLPVLLSIFAGLGITYTGVWLDLSVQLSVLVGLCITFVCLQSARVNAQKSAIRAQLAVDAQRDAELARQRPVTRRKRR